MPQLDPSKVLICLSDQVTPVRDLAGKLLGCIPRVEDDQATYVSSPSGQNFEIWTAAQQCIRCDPKTHDPMTLEGFFPLVIENADLADGVTVTTAGDDPDIGQAV